MKEGGDLFSDPFYGIGEIISATMAKSTGIP
jgi:hypothetical protein